MTGWFRCDSDGWEAVAEMLSASGRKWPIEVIRMDLAWWLDQARHPTNPRRLPGRRTLCQRWHCSDWTAREALRELGPSRSPPAPLPLPSRHDTVEPAQSADILPLPSRSPPASLHTRVEVLVPDYQTQTTDSVPPLESPPDEPLGVWRHWRGLHLPDGSEPHGSARALRKADRECLAARIREEGVEAVVLVLDWAHLAPTASRWRKEDWLGLYTLCKSQLWSDRLEKAQRWAQAGRPVARNGRAHPAASPADEAWACVLRGVSGNWRGPDFRWCSDEALHARIWAALDRMGGVRVVAHEDERWVGKHKPAFEQAYREVST